MGQNQPAPKVLVVDDNAQNRALAEAILEDEGYGVCLASSGDEGIAAFQAERPDCVLLDVRMPDMDGFAVCTRLRDLPGGADIPIVFFTALRDIDTFDRALRVGADDFLTKPVRPTELVVRVQSALKVRRMSAELREQYELVRRQRDDLMRLQLQKERLSAFVVHDLKSPVSTMDLLTQVLLRDSSLSSVSRANVQRIRHEARSLLRLVLNLLDISKSEEGQFTLRRATVDLSGLVNELVDSHAVQAQAAGITLANTVHTGAMEGDADLLGRILENLLDNALRHAPEGSTIRISSTQDNGAVVLRVADAGPGISAEQRERIFERFVQFESNERALTRAGRGLGLAFCKVAVEAHGGTIWVEDENPGAAFCLRFPCES